MVLAWRFAWRITADDLAEMLREAVFRRFGEERAQAEGIEHYNREAPHSALEMQSPAEFYAEWRVKNKTQPVQN